MSDTWPPQLKDWVGKCLGQMTDANRAEAQAEMKKVISDAFASQALWTTDWAGVQLQTLQPKPLVAFNAFKNLSSFNSNSSVNGGSLSLKRKSDNPSPTNKKAKKNITVKNSTNVIDPNDRAALDRRAERFRREHDIERQKTMKASITNSYSSQLTHSRYAMPHGFNNSDDSNLSNWDHHTIVGTSQQLFKDYLRLTSEPKPETIRPLPILRDALDALKEKWRTNKNYNWICSQMKSIRQDLTVQRIQNEFTVLVYEIHARIALEENDVKEYDTCLNQLTALYQNGLNGKVEEFTAYRILSLLHGMNRSELNFFVAKLTPEQKSHNAVRNALEIQRALAMGNYHRFFKLYQAAPNMGAYIIDQFADRERTRALIVMTKSYQRLALSFLSDELAFEDPKEVIEYLTTHNVAFFSNPNAAVTDKLLDCKPCVEPLSNYFDQHYRKAKIKDRV